MKKHDRGRKRGTAWAKGQGCGSRSWYTDTPTFETNIFHFEMFSPLVKATFDEENKIKVAYKEIGPNFGKRAREGHETGKGRKKMGNED